MVKNTNLHILYCCFFFVSAVVLIGCEPEIIIKKIPKYRDCIAEPAPLYLPGEMTYGRVAGLKNCLPFLASAIAYIGEDSNDLVGLEITTYEGSDNNFTNKEFIGIGANANSIGTWPLLVDTIPQLTFQFYSTVRPQGDLEDIFYIDKSYEYNRLVITSINTLDRRIQGWFECRFILSSIYPSGVNPDTILFTECHFYAIDPP